MSHLTKDQILAVCDLVTESVPVPEWGGDVLVRVLTGADRDTIEQLLVEAQKGEPKNYRAKVCVLAMCDDAGGRLFDHDDIEILGQKSWKALDRVYNKAIDINAVGEQGIGAAEGN